MGSFSHSSMPQTEAFCYGSGSHVLAASERDGDAWPVQAARTKIDMLSVPGPDATLVVDELQRLLRMATGRTTVAESLADQELPSVVDQLLASADLLDVAGCRAKSLCLLGIRRVVVVRCCFSAPVVARLNPDP
jgi:hypothetical protein